MVKPGLAYGFMVTFGKEQDSHNINAMVKIAQHALVLLFNLM